MLVLTRNRGMVALLLLVVGMRAAEAQPRYWALFRDGSQVTGEEFTDGDSWGREAKLAGRRLFDAPNPVRALGDDRLGAPAGGARLLMANGDVVPGKVLRFLAASPQLGLPDRLVISPRASLTTTDPDGLSVRADRVLRIVADLARPLSRGPISQGPGRLVFADGRTVTATAIRWSQQGVSALSAGGIVTAAFDEIADLTIPRVDAVGAVLDDAVYPPLDGARLIGRLETVDGTVLTYHRSMTRVAARKAARRPARKSKTPVPRFLHLQPSWALGPILVPIDAICRRTFRTPDEVPLSLLPAELLARRHGLYRWPWRRNLNVLGGVLQSGQVTAGLGVGTHSHSEIAFELPSGAKRFSGLVGLDDAVGDGGCARARIYRENVAGKPLFDSGLLRGSDGPVRVGPLSVADAKRLVLVTEFAHQDRPPGADPLDIRDHVDWLLPMITLDGAPPGREALLRRFLPGWQTWTLGDDDARRVSVSASWDEALQRWEPAVQILGSQPIALRRTISRVSYANDLVEVNLAPAGRMLAHRIELRVDDALVEPVTKDPLADWGGGNIRPARSNQEPLDAGLLVRWDLQEYHGQAVELSLTIGPTQKSPGFAWRGCRLNSAIRNLPPEGRPLTPDVPLTSLEPVDVYSRKMGFPPARNRLPGRGSSLPIAFLGQPYEDGYAMIRDSRITFALDPSYRGFVAVAGCCHESAGPFRVQLDDRDVSTTGPMNETMQAVQVQVEIPPGAKKLTLTIGKEGSPQGVGAWAMAGFIKP